MKSHKPRPRIALFVESHEGFGHFNIVSQLARKLQDAGAEVMVLSGTLNYAGAGHTFNFKDAQVVHLPLVDYRISKKGKWEFVDSEGTPYAHSPAAQLRHNTVQQAIAHFRPHALITEYFPFQQSFRTGDIDAAHALYPAGSRPQTLCLCRDIIHNSNPKDVLSTLNRQFDAILVRGDKAFAQLHESQPEWRNISQPIHYMGNFITSMPSRSKHTPHADRHVVVFGGGGYYEADIGFFKAVIAARSLSRRYSHHVWDIYLSENAQKHSLGAETTGHGYGMNAMEYIQHLAQSHGHGKIRVFGPIDSKKFRAELSDAAIAITRGGYNTTFELCEAGTPQLVVPRTSQEQIQRANALYKQGMAQIYPPYPIESKIGLHDKISDLEMLARAIDSCATTPLTTPSLNNHGAETTAHYIIKQVKGKPAPALLHTAQIQQRPPEFGTPHR